MTQTVPLYIVFTKSDEKAHISAGKKPQSLCSDSTIYSAKQINTAEDELISTLKEQGYQICENCETVWDSISHKVSPEPTVPCNRCDQKYSSILSRTVEHKHSGEVPVCRPCYKELYEDEDSGVRTPYSEAEPYLDKSVESRVLELDVLEE